MQAFQKLGRYLLTSEIASGGMATVYQGTLLGIEGFQKEVAIKKILPQWSQNPEFIKMLIDEAKMLVSLNHHNIVQVFELGKDQNIYFIAMEYVDGVDLKKLLNNLKQQNLSLPLHLACFIVKQVCQGLDYAHHRRSSQGKFLKIIHRDISPQNILVSRDGQIKITDFGIAKIIGKSQETATGILKGKFSYMSPEQASGKDIDERTDLFALGLVFYEMICGQKAFTGNNDLEILSKVRKTQINIPTDLPKMLRSILVKALAADPKKRYQSAKDFLQDLAKFELMNHLSGSADDFKNFLDSHIAQDFRQPHPVFITDQTTQGTAVVEQTSEQNVPQNINTSESQKATLLHQLDHQTLVLSTTVMDSQLLNKKHNTTSFLHKQKSYSIRKQVTRHSKHILGMSAAATFFVLLVMLFANKKNHPTSNTVLASVKEITQTITQPKLAVSAPMMLANNTMLARENQHHPLFFDVITQPKNAKITVSVDGKTWSGTGSFKKNIVSTQRFNKAKVVVIAKNHQKKEIVVNFTPTQNQFSSNIELTEQEFGTLKLSAYPWANVIIEGVGKFETPNEIKVPVGKHLVRFTFPPGNQNMRHTLLVESNQTQHCKARFGTLPLLMCE